MYICNLCPRNCNVARDENVEVGMGKGICKMGLLPVVARVSVHRWEEPCISGTNGSGTVFFSGCNLKCVFCQNYKISSLNYGKQITVQDLTQIYSFLVSKKVHNINLVNPTHFVEAICKSLQNQISVPIVYNSSGYESVETLKLLKGKVQIYMPDLKYADNSVAFKYSKVDNYFEIATKAIEYMYSQVGDCEFDENEILKKGVVIRHLILPNNIENSLKVIDWVNENFKSKKIMFSLMSQYVPYGKSDLYPEINRRLNKKEYSKVEKYLLNTEIEDGYIQELNSAEDIYIPNFEYGKITTD